MNMNSAPQILIVDDEDSLRDSMSQVLRKEGAHPHGAARGEDALALFNRETFEAVFLDLRLPDIDGLTVLRQIRETSPETPVIIITAYGSIDSAVEAIKLGAFEYLTKPFTPDELRLVTQKALKSRTMILENIRLRGELRVRKESRAIIGQSKALRQVFDTIAMVSPTDSAVLITGESGTGKELIAREIHGRSPRHAAPFIAVDCGFLAEPILENELFGYAKGTFPGAQETRHGQFELAGGGTIFLDEIANASPQIQGKILRTIQERGVVRRGSSRPIKIDVRLISASGINLAQAVSRGVFREDLFYRLNVVPIHIPPLRERKDDIPLLVEHFLPKYSRKAGKTVTRISTRAMLALTEYDWPGNVRELENTIERAVVLTRNDGIDIEDIVSHGISLGIPALTWAGGKFKLLSEIEKEYIRAVLRDQRGNKGRTARILGIDRKTLWAKIKKYGLEGRELS
jgi:DNA-binding NtrC family response regulator